MGTTNPPKIKSMSTNTKQVTVCQIEVADLERIVTNAVATAMEQYASSTTPTRDANNDSDELMTVQQVSGYLHRSRTSIWRYAQQGIIVPVRRGRSIYFRRTDVLSMFNKIL